jgi:hypothetical protein
MSETITSILKGSKALADRYKNDATFRAKVNKGGVKFLQSLKGKNKGKNKGKSKSEQIEVTETPETKEPKQGSSKMLIYGGIGLLVLLFLAKR